ncbi:MAG: ABC transporter ATP-binding protein [Chloroflexota bacterium]
MDHPETKSPENNSLVVTMKGIVKRFPGVLANDHTDFELRKGEIHALLGENGAGKSTLMNVLAGLYSAESGIITVNQKQVEFNSPKDAIKAGIGMIHQHFMLVPSQTVTENILLGMDEPRFRMNLNEYDQKIAVLGKRFGMEVDPKAKIWQLSVGEQQRVEILKMLYRGAQVLIMDEPTAVLAPQEADVLFETLRSMVADGKSIIFISHKLQEVMAIADRVTVLRKGKVTAAGVPTEGSTRQELAHLMVGRDVVFQMEKKPQAPGKVVLQVQNAYAENDKGLPAVNGISFQIHQGEIYGLAGVAGNGQRELSQMIAGLRKSTKGSIHLNGVEINNHPAQYSIERGLAYVPEDRNHVGSAPNLSMTDNVIMKNYTHEPISHGWLLDIPAAKHFAQDLKEAYNIAIPTINTPVRLLSGGNLQRVILAREISGHPALLVAVQPTRGLDVGAIEGVHKLLLAQREAGAAILLISEELEELFSLSDRVAVIYEGHLMGELSNPDMETVGMMMTGTPLEQITAQTVTGAENHG